MWNTKITELIMLFNKVKLECELTEMRVNFLTKNSSSFFWKWTEWRLESQDNMYRSDECEVLLVKERKVNYRYFSWLRPPHMAYHWLDSINNNKFSYNFEGWRPETNVPVDLILMRFHLLASVQLLICSMRTVIALPHPGFHLSGLSAIVNYDLKILYMVSYS